MDSNRFALSDAVRLPTRSGISFSTQQVVEPGRVNRSVAQLEIFTRAPEQQAASAHITAPGEIRREKQARAENRQQRFEILRRRDTSEQHNDSFRRK